MVFIGMTVCWCLLLFLINSQQLNLELSWTISNQPSFTMIDQLWWWLTNWVNGYEPRTLVVPHWLTSPAHHVADVWPCNPSRWPSSRTFLLLEIHGCYVTSGHQHTRSSLSWFVGSIMSCLSNCFMNLAGWQLFHHMINIATMIQEKDAEDLACWHSSIQPPLTAESTSTVHALLVWLLAAGENGGKSWSWSQAYTLVI